MLLAKMKLKSAIWGRLKSGVRGVKKMFFFCPKRLLWCKSVTAHTQIIYYTLFPIFSLMCFCKQIIYKQLSLFSYFSNCLRKNNRKQIKNYQKYIFFGKTRQLIYKNTYRNLGEPFYWHLLKSFRSEQFK